MASSVLIFLALASPSSATVGAPSAAPDLGVRIFPSATEVYEGQKVAYLVLVSNLGTATAAGITLTITLTGGAELLSSSSDRGPQCTGTTTLTCTVESLLAKQAARVRLGVKVTTFGALVNTASVLASPPDLNAANDQVSVSVTVRPGHAGPPQLRASERTLDARQDGNAALVVTEVSVDERSTLTASVMEVKSKRPIRLLKGSRIGGSVLSRQSARLAVDVTRAQTLRMRLRLPLERLERGRLYRIAVHAVDAEGETADTFVRFALLSSRRG